MGEPCNAALNIKGEHFYCELPDEHIFAHMNTKAEAIWCGDEGPTQKELFPKGKMW